MQNWSFIIRKKLYSHFFIYSTQTSLFIVVAFSIMSFTPDYSRASSTNDVLLNASGNDDTTKGFVSLLSNTNLNELNGADFELNSMAAPFVEEFIKKNGNKFENMKVWGKPYFNLYDDILAKYGLPIELKYLSVIESNLKSGLVSWAGAAGPWQIMPTEARRCGLKTGGAYDERNDYTKSTNAAAKLLKGLYSEFGDWLLVIAAYNAGPGGVNRAIKKAGSTSFWDIQYYLPLETRNHVKKFIATHYYFEGSGGWTTITADETKIIISTLGIAHLNATNLENTATLEISGKYNSVVIANALFMDITLFGQLNPLIDKTLSQGKAYQLRLPTDKIELFRAKKQEILKESVQLLLSSALVILSGNQIL